MSRLGVHRALKAGVDALREAGRRFALIGGLAVGVRSELRFTKDVDLAVQVENDADAERLIFGFQGAGFSPLASIENKTHHRLSTIRLRSPQRITVDLLFASCGIEEEVISRAALVEVAVVGELPVAQAEELLAMKILSMSARRLQDQVDAQRLIQFNPGLDLVRVRANLRLIRERGYDRGEDLDAKLASVLAAL